MMGATTKINWCDATWNPITGCSPVSDGCARCYASRIAKRFPASVGGDFRVRFHKNWLDIPMRWIKSKRIFVCSMGDFFHDDVKLDWIYRILQDVILRCPQHTFMILTKRPENILKKLPKDWGTPSGGVLQNLWLGVSVENQEQADKRIPILLSIPAAKRFVSIEPMLGPVNLNLCIECQLDPAQCFEHYKLDWVIVGRETGPGARPMELDWVRSIRDQCVSSGTPFFFKNGSPECIIAGVPFFYKSTLLDGELWHQWPEEK